MDIVVYALLNNKITAVQNTTANQYEEKTYSVGSLIIYENKLYKCINAVTIPEPFDASKWEEVNLDGLLQNKADLVNGKVPLSQLSGYIPETEEVATYNDLPNPGQADLLYITLDDGKSYRWTGSTYVEVGDRNTYYSVPVTNMSTMGELRDYIDSINSQGLHCFFDFSSYVVNAYVCTVLMFTQNNVNYCLVFDIINGRTYLNYSGYQDNETIASYLSGNEDNLIRTLKITDANTTMADISALLTKVNSFGHHVMFDVSALNAGAYLCTIFIDGTTVKILDTVSQKSTTVTYDGTALLSTLLSGMAALAKIDEVGCITINAPASTTLTDAEYAIFTTGKIVKVNGSFLGYKNPILYPLNNADYGLIIGTTTFNMVFAIYYIEPSSKVISIRTSNPLIQLRGIGYFNDKAIPAYPSSPSTRRFFTYTTDNTLSWYNFLYGESFTNSTTELTYEKINNISISADTTFTLKTAQTNCIPTYEAIIENTSSSAIVITLTGITKINTNDANITIVNNTFTLPGNTSVEVNIQNGHALVYKW